VRALLRLGATQRVSRRGEGFAEGVEYGTGFPLRGLFLGALHLQSPLRVFAVMAGMLRAPPVRVNTHGQAGAGRLHSRRGDAATRNQPCLPRLGGQPSRRLKRARPGSSDGASRSRPLPAARCALVSPSLWWKPRTLRLARLRRRVVEQGLDGARGLDAALVL